MEAVISKPIVSIYGGRSLKQNFELLLELIKKDLKVRYKNIFAGITWMILQPLILALLFANIRNIVTYNYTIYKLSYEDMYVVLVIWYFFVTSLIRGTGSISSGYYLINTHKFPIILFPISVVLSTFFDVIINLAFYIIFLFIAKGALALNIFFLLPILFISSIFILGLSIIFALLQIFMQETNQIVLFLNKLSLFALPILYNSSFIPENIREIYKHIPIVWMITKTKTLVGNPLYFTFKTDDLIVVFVSIFTLIVAYLFYKLTEDFILDYS